MRQCKQNWFNTLNEALESEGLIELYPTGVNMPYSSVIRIVKNGVFITIYRDSNGMYERPIHYSSKMHDHYQIQSA